VIQAFLYDADGHDREVELNDQCVGELGERNLLWVDVIGREPTELSYLARLFDLDRRSIRELLQPQNDLYLENYGEYFQFDVVALKDNGEKAHAERDPVHLEFLVGLRWIISVHDEPLGFLEAFRDQDKGETLTGALSPPALVASLLDWHLTSYFEALAGLEAFVDRVDEAMLGRSTKDSHLAGLVALRRRISRLRRLLVLQRPVFYGLSRPDMAQVVNSDAGAHYRSLERRFERAVDAADHARELVHGSFDLFSTRAAEATNDLVRRLTFVTMLLGVTGAIAGIFGMNFDTPHQGYGALGFWGVVGFILLLIAVAVMLGRRKKWI
jgi:Mg2+ and Co2+ transporter CorA